MIVNQRVRFAVWMSNKNQQELAGHLGVSQPMINKYIKGISTPSDDTLMKLSELSQISFAWLKHGTKELEPAGFTDFINSVGLTREELIKKVSDLTNELEKKDLIIKGLEKEVDLLNRIAGKK